MVTQYANQPTNAPSPPSAADSCSTLTDTQGKAFTGEEAWLLFAKVSCRKFFKCINNNLRQKKINISEKSRL